MSFDLTAVVFQFHTQVQMPPSQKADCTAPIRQHELDPTDHTGHTYHTDDTDDTDHTDNLP